MNIAVPGMSEGKDDQLQFRCQLFDETHQVRDTASGHNNVLTQFVRSQLEGSR